MQIILLYVPIWYVYQHFEANIPSVFSKQTMKMHQTVFIIAVGHVIPQIIFGDSLHTFSLQLNYLNFFAYTLLIRATVHRSFSI
jgi:hypothetical protein